MSSEIISRCPKCGYVPLEPLPATAACPACGVYFFKLAQRPFGEIAPDGSDAAVVGNGERFSLLQPLAKIDAVSFYGRCAALALLALWSWFLIGYDYRYAEINGSFMHNILLPIHEAGHVLFTPLGEFMMILGGSFFQLLLPLGIGVAFIWKYLDNFGAAIGLWWGGASLVDLSPYIYDALHPQMILLGGHTGEDGPHDWIYLLDTLGQLHRAQGWGTFIHTCGALLMIASLAWGAGVLWRQKKSLAPDWAGMKDSA